MTRLDEFLLHEFTQRITNVRARDTCRRCGMPMTEAEDVRQAMLVHLVKAFERFDPAQGPLEAFVTTVVMNWIRAFIRDRNRIKRGRQFRFTTLHEVSSCQRAGRCAESPFEVAMLRERIDHALADLDPDERDLLLQVATHGISATARHRGKSRYQVSRRLSKFRRRIRK